MRKICGHSTTTIAVALILLMIFAPLIAFLNFTNITGVNAQTDYGDLMQYDWPHMFGDPERTGFSAGPAPNKPDIAWRSSETAPTLGAVSGMMIAFNGRIFVQSSVFMGPNYINALDAITGELLWQSEIPLPAGYSTSAAGGPQGPTMIDDHHIVVSAFPPQPLGKFHVAGALVCFNADNGSYLWTSPEYGSSESPGAGMYFNYLSVPEENRLFTVSANWPVRDEPVVRAFDTSDPSQPFPIAWNYSQLSEGGTEVLCYGDGKVFCGSYQGYVYALNASTGALVWRAEHIGAVGYSGTYYDGKLYAGCSSTRMTCYDGNNGTIIWDNDEGGRAFFAYGGCAAYGRYFQHNIAVPTGFIAAWDAENGEELWKIDAISFIGYNVPVVADGKVYVIKSDGSTTAGRPPTPLEFVCLDAFSGAVLWSLPTNYAVPMIAYGNLYAIGGGYFDAYIICYGGSPKPWSMWRGNIDTPGIAIGQSGPRNVSFPKWIYETEGHIVSSPAVADGKVYIGSHDKYIYCLDAYDGSLVWRFLTGYKVRSSPAVVDGRVYTGADDGSIYCIDASTGGQIWNTPAGGETEAQFQAIFQPRSSPIIKDGKLYVGACDGKFYCLNTIDGSIAWTYQTGNVIGGSPAIADGLVYIPSTDGDLYCFNTTTESLVWRTPIPNATFLGEVSMIGTPVIADGKVFIENGQEFFVFFGPPPPPKLYALDAYNGTILWGALIEGASPEAKSPAYYNGWLIMGTDMWCSAISATDGSVVWSQWVGHQVFSSPAITDDGLVYIGTDSYGVQCLDANQNGTSLSVYTTGAQVHSSPAIWEGKVYVGSMDNKVYCFDDAPEVSTSIVACLDKEKVNMSASESVEVIGQLQPGIPNAPVMVTFSRPDLSTVDVSATSDEMGLFSASYTPDVKGNWTATAWYAGEAYVSHSYTYSYLDLPFTVVTTVEPTNGNGNGEPTNGDGEAGIPMEYVYVAVAVIVILIVAVAAYAFMKRRR